MPRTWNNDKRCAECCNGDRCDDPTHVDRQNCRACKGTGWALWTEAGRADWLAYMRKRGLTDEQIAGTAASYGVNVPAPARWCPECRSAGVVGIEQDVCPTCDGTGKVAAVGVKACQVCALDRMGDGPAKRCPEGANCPHGAPSPSNDRPEQPR